MQDDIVTQSEAKLLVVLPRPALGEAGEGAALDPELRETFERDLVGEITHAQLRALCVPLGHADDELVARRRCARPGRRCAGAEEDADQKQNAASVP
jgi:hypothetical protein